jgi:hypothetical protein
MESCRSLNIERGDLFRSVSLVEIRGECARSTHLRLLISPAYRVTVIAMAEEGDNPGRLHWGEVSVVEVEGMVHVLGGSVLCQRRDL